MFKGNIFLQVLYLPPIEVGDIRPQRSLFCDDLVDL
jgi:hypothetical protein